MKKQQVKIMDEEEFALYYQEMKEEVKEWKMRGWKRNEVCCGMSYRIGGEEEYAFTGKQIRELFDLCF